MPDSPPKRAIGDEPEPFDWEKYNDRVHASVLAVEEHLEVPTGTISSIPRDPDFVATVKAYAVAEPILNQLIAARPPRAPGGGFGALSYPGPPDDEYYRAFVTALPISGNTGKLRLAEGLNLLSPWHLDFVRALARIRNRYAHNIRNMHRSLTELLLEEQSSNKKIVEHLTGLQVELPEQRLPNGVFLMLMHHRLADLLSEALHTLRPPPAPPGGILSAFFPPSDPDSERSSK